MAKFDVKALREKVLASDDIQYGEVYVDEWDVTLPIKTLASNEMKQVMKFRSDMVRMMNLAVIYGCKTKEGESVFNEKDLAKLEAEKSFGAIQKIAGKILEMSGFYDGAENEAKND
ncbi:hypothetical protein [Bacillus sp. 7894-2]|uniref:hypothetical protein n=1 Tax=Bacillus sp. 7894-2 TaxID=2021695 RepID=UPI000BA53068|nr:hypothetical protein [Bacillus sp. 7894-2]PAE24079.1 hypothetical protein CHI10_14855 [Bacillus sp. 7894-2]